MKRASRKRASQASARGGQLGVKRQPAAKASQVMPEEGRTTWVLRAIGVTLAYCVESAVLTAASTSGVVKRARRSASVFSAPKPPVI